MFRLFYTVVFYLLLPLVLLRLFWRGRKAPAYRRRWRERLGYFSAPETFRHGIWVHAVSVGETIAAAPLVRRLQRECPDLPIVVTTMTPTGSERVQALFGDSVFHVYAPWDYPGAVRRFLRRLHPRMLVIMETELWPNMVYHSHLRGIPVVLANARLSEKSARGYAHVRLLTREMLVALEKVAVQTAEEAERFHRLGLPRRRLLVTGSVKFDLDLSPELEERARALRAQWGRDRRVLIAASTHEGEEEQVLDAWRDIREQVEGGLLVLVPRHPERFDRVADLCHRRGYRVARRGANETVEAGTDVYLGDTMGELLMMCGAADIAFVGGSLIDHGGHNVLEPAALGRPVIVGKSCFNFTEITYGLKEAGGLFMVENESGLANRAVELFGNPRTAELMGEAGRAMVDANRGALQRLVDLLLALLAADREPETLSD